MAYDEAPPPPALADRVACLWWRTPDAVPAGGAPAHLVLPDGCVDLVWHAGRLTVAGPDTGPVAAAPSSATTVGVRLRPGAVAVLGESAAVLRDERVGTDALWGRVGAELADRVAHAPDDRGRLALLTAAVARRAAAAGPPDAAVAAAVSALSGPGATVAGAARGAGLSDRQLRRRFLEHVGYGPKTLDRVLRLQRFLTLAITTTDDLAALAASAGYADQAHLTREARALAATTPRELVAARRPAPAPGPAPTARA
ncbi:helix-turn-helix domain-containing protein [Patulibacter americanus]|uniref:helix-turn-helix domain-containing protein n=1 Tax=Patulibacter americanus TaxID=588672 RepID=UPI0003B6B9FD|nr:helix-turn-helix domain-containing protein [Patulibacter americanus]